MVVDEKTRLIAELDAARVDMWQLVDALDPNTEIYPGWTSREMLAHIAGWESVVWQIFNDALNNAPLNPALQDIIKNTDAANAHFVAERQSVPLESARRECEINRFAIKTLLAAIPADAFVTEGVQFPWGRETFARWTQGAIEHERFHGGDMAKLVTK